MKIDRYKKTSDIEMVNSEYSGSKNEGTHDWNSKCFAISLFYLIIITLLAIPTANAQESTVKILVTDEAGYPIENASLQLLAVPDGEIKTNELGIGEFKIAPEGYIRVSYNGMTKLISVDDQYIKVMLRHSDKKMKLGFGYEKSQDQITSSMDVVYADELAKSSLNNPEEALYGRLLGLTVLQNGGEPWNRNPDMFIRGKSTFNNNSMLVLVDGFERNLSSLSLAEIESVSVLKDGAALAIYGQRGANGVMLVTTKRGEFNSFEVDVSFDRGFNEPLRMPRFLDGYNYALAVNEASQLDGNNPVYTDWDLQDFQIGNQPSFFPNVNWIKETLRDYGSTMNFNSSFRGGGESVKYFVSLNYQNERGLLDNTTLDDRYDSQMGYDRFNFRSNLDIDLTSSTTFYVDLAGNINGTREPGGRVSGIMDALYSVPSSAFPVETYNGVWGGTEFFDNNPVALASSTGFRSPHGREIYANARIVQDLSKWVNGLSGEAAIAYDNRANYWDNRTRGFLYESVTVSRDFDTGAVNDTTVARYGNDTDLRPSDSFGGQMRHATVWGKLNYDTSFGNTDLNTSIMFHQDKRVNDGQYNTFLHQNVVAITSYGYKNRYFLDGTLSYNGSNLLPKGDRFGLFPSISGGWIISREDFFQEYDNISFLKFRASWGLSGNNIMSPNLFDQAFPGGSGYLFTNNNNNYGGIREGQLATTGLTHEKASMSNMGLELEWKGRLQFSLDAFYEKRYDILASTAGFVPSLIGVAQSVQNVGEVENKGIEAAFMWKDNLGDFSYFVGGNFSYARNRILEMSEEFQPYHYLRQTGNPIGQQFGLEALGFFKDNVDIENSPRQLFSEYGPGDVKYKDQNGNGIVDQLDVVPIGYSGDNPEIYFSSNLGFEWKGFGVDALFQGIANQTIFLNTKSVFWPLRGQNSISTFSNDRWTPETAEQASLPRLSMEESANNYRRNDIWLTKGDYIKLRQLEVYYSLSAKWLRKLSSTSNKVFIRGMNLFSWDSVGVVDPEATGVTYPTLSSYHVGLNLGF